MLFFPFFFAYIIILFFIYVFGCLVNPFLDLDYSFQEIPIGYKRSTSSGAQFRPTLRNIRALRRAIKSFSFDLGLRSFLHELPRLLERFNSWQPTFVTS